MRCDCLCCVMSRDALRCHGDELLSVVPRHRMECYELKMPLVVRSCRVVQSVTMWWSKELLCTTPYYSSTTLYYKVLRQYYSVLQSTTPVLQSTTPVLLCTTKYYSSTTKYYASTTLYYKELLCTTKYYSSTLLCTTKYMPVLQSTTPVLLCATKYYSSLLQYYNVLQIPSPVLPSTTPVLLCTTKYYSGTTLKRHLQCAEQQEAPSNFTKKCTCHAK